MFWVTAINHEAAHLRNKVACTAGVNPEIEVEADGFLSWAVRALHSALSGALLCEGLNLAGLCSALNLRIQQSLLKFLVEEVFSV